MIELSEVEDEIIRLTIVGILNAGYSIKVNDGEDFVTDFTTDINEITSVLKTTDCDYLYCYDKDLVQVGHVWFVYGNSEWEIICDYTISIEHGLNDALKFGELACDYYA